MKNFLMPKGNLLYFASVSPYRPVEVFITAEDNSNLRTRGTQIVMTTKSF
ncbi:hypothetical protein [Mucilaginibacter corticis]|nr:hypothetical protein [Mucilaginibacter corticis]